MISGVFISGNVDFFMLVGKIATFPNEMYWRATLKHLLGEPALMDSVERK
jgi:hypothetical protein